MLRGKLAVTEYALCSSNHITCWKSRGERGPSLTLEALKALSDPTIWKAPVLSTALQRSWRPWTPTGSSVLKTVHQKESETTRDPPATGWLSAVFRKVWRRQSLEAGTFTKELFPCTRAEGRPRLEHWPWEYQEEDLTTCVIWKGKCFCLSFPIHKVMIMVPIIQTPNQLGPNQIGHTTQDNGEFLSNF